VPTLQPGQIVILDNLSFHKSAKVKTLSAVAQCSLVFLPAYSPDLNAIEMLWSQFRGPARTRSRACRSRHTTGPPERIGW
jgi:transposase